MSELTKIDGPYGSERVPVPGVTDPALNAAGAVSLDGERILLDDNRVARDPGFAEARGAREQRLLRPEASLLESLGAGVNSWDTTRMLKRIMRPGFDGDTPINQAEYLQEVPLVLTEDEREYFMDVGTGQKSAEYAMEQIQDRRRSAQAVGDHPIVGLAASFLDPLWLAVPPAARFGKMSPVAGRSLSALTAAGVAGVVTAGGEGPISDSEIALSMLMNGAAGAVLYRPGKGLVPADPEFPSTRLKDSLDAVQSPVGASPAKPRYRMVEPERWEEVQIPGTPAQFTDEVLPGPVIGSPRYKNTELQFGSDIDKAAYIVAGKGKSAKHADILAWAERESGLTPEQLMQRGEAIRAELKVRAKDNPTTLEVPGVLPGSKPRIKRTETAPAQPARTERRKVADARWEQVPEELQPGAVNSDPAKVVAAVDTAVSQQQQATGWGKKIMWNMHKTMEGFGTAGKKVADLLYDNNSDLSLTSVEAHREAILSELRTRQFAYEDSLRRAMAEDGFGLGKMVNPGTSRQAYQMQGLIEQEVQKEMFRREQLTRNGLPTESDKVPARIAKMADQLDELHKHALKEMQAAGVEGAENLLERPGYMNRRWSSLHIDQTIDKIQAMGLTREAAHAKVTGLVSLSLRRGNALDKELADQIGQSIVDRALRKGYFEDSVFNAPAGEGQLKELRDVLSAGGMSGANIERALDVLRVQTDEAGKAGFMKHRMDLDYKATVRVGDLQFSIMDLIDSRVSTIVDQYVQQVGTSAAFAKKGLNKRSDIEKLRDELMHDVPVEQRAQAKELFDNTIAHLRGDPAGAKINENFRLMQSYGRSISLAWSGLWQLTEFANAMGEYGLRKTLKYAAQEIPGFKQVMQGTPSDARSLNNVLAEHSSASMRLRPYIAKFEDGYEMDTSSALQLSAQTAGQMVPYANAMRYVHHRQAKVVGNLILDRLNMAANGDTAAREALAKYGLEYPIMDKLGAEIKQHGFNVDDWSDEVWHATRPAFAKMMDASVLKGRLGDVPAFAAFDPVGKFVFTYRTFVLTAHNKVLAGGAERNGTAAVGLVMMYQFPLALAAVQAQNVIREGKVLGTEELVTKAMGQMGGLGLFSEPIKWATGESNSIGAPALIPLDRGVKLFQAGTNLDPAQGASTAVTMIPVISAVPFIRGMANQIKE